MNKKEICEHLNNKGIQYEITEHKAVYNMAELSEVELPYPEADAKNLFIRDDKKRQYYLVTVRGDKRVDLKEFRKNNETRPLSFASEEDLFNLLKLTPGSVTPLGLLNDSDRSVIFYLDSDFHNGLIGCHPNDNTATIWLNINDLISVIEEHGNIVHVVDI
ncbi:MAG: prolyl-tRNA synthetase associated domain-containing protein [Clostridiaceae bacterium]|jgi:Ala-tRNA(Pro) deacylase|nr:prolyl-tRNA synthetase associated domain-containing protein [Clostridiaceae bacterium]